MNEKILIIDDEPAICASLTLALEDMYDVKATTSPMEGIKLVNEDYFNLCLLDLKIGKYDGIEILKEIKGIDKNLIVILMTAYGSINSSVEAIKKGAYTYLTKPLNIAELYVVIEQGFKFQQLNAKIEYLSNELDNKYQYGGMIGRSPSMKNVFKLIDKLKDVDSNVLVTGESGTGKELVARALHYSGKRCNEYFEEINCAAIPEGLLEEELFGHKKGSFTGAIDNKKGKFEFANNGTIFLDEIGDMSMSLQSKLLRVLEEKKITPIGSNDSKKIDVRMVAATNRDLKTMVVEGRFRKDLYFRLNVVEIKLPALKDRRQDLPLLFSYFINKYNVELNKNIEGISKEAEIKLLNYNYPGNIRELSNIFEYSIILTNKEIISLTDLPEEVRLTKENIVQKENLFMDNLVGSTLKEIEKKAIVASLIKNNGHRKNTANMLGISDKGLRNKIAEYDIKEY